MEQSVLRELIERNADGMLVLDRAGRVVFANGAVGKLLGRRTEELIGEPFGSPITDGETTEIDIFTRGRQRVAELRAVDFNWHDEPATLVSLRDITSRKEAAEQQRALAVAQARQADAEERAARAAFLADVSEALERSSVSAPDVEGLCRLCSKAFADWCAVDMIRGDKVRRESCSMDEGGVLVARLEDTLGDEPVVDEISGAAASSLANSLSGDWRGSHVLRVAIRSGDHAIGALTALRRPGRPFSDADVELAREVARRAANSLERARLYREAHEASRAKSDFLAVISHELRTPLNAIMGYAQLMDEGIAGAVSADQKHHIAKIHESSSHLLQLVDQILTYVQIEGGQEHLDLADASLEEILRDAAKVASPLAEAAGLSFRLELPAGAARLHTDARKLHQALANLLTNAVKYTSEGAIVLSAQVSGDRCRIEVRDTGIGMDQDQLEHMFDPFWQAEPASTRQRGGAGLGASVAQRLARLLGGELHVLSEPGAGTRCLLMLPLRYRQA